LLDFAALDVALGLIFVYLVLALVCSALNEAVASALGWRAKFLRAGIANLLDPADNRNGQVLAKVLYDHPLVNALIQSCPPPLRRHRASEGRSASVPAGRGDGSPDSGGEPASLHVRGPIKSQLGSEEEAGDVARR
jgi:hypothetical protein